MAYQQADIDALKRAIATGGRKVRYESGGEVREVTYRSLDEMERSLAAMEREIAGASRPRSVLVSHDRSR
ncbi:hypothetical protein T281_13800 [Rhodomicrobium udaipurense JA643]|uniref:Uncharacterized protein n=1 Tax=Rhodomicrobium udaipurense TaxID=1202716 RepID=A0A8I1KLF7_9HYPH|nr:hypothetical protein [Rhodomicrobium udaipurense]KAI93925.1 hypothetical protein T281_13800 [Rhodomicrobium udaipurense JA643]MBJ7543253.1 hypothetical protein [Rhodomicrobium udaipurense]